MRRCLAFFLFVPLLFCSCNQLGRKVTVNKNGEVYFKGSVVSKNDADRLGQFLWKQGYFSSWEKRSVHLSGDSRGFVVRMIIDQNQLETEKDVLTAFRVWQMWIQDSVFFGKRTRLILSDKSLKDLKEVDSFTASERMQLEQGIFPLPAASRSPENR